MPGSRKEIRHALLARLRDETSVVLATDRELTSEDLVGRQPALVLRGLGSAQENEADSPEIWRHGYSVILYARNGVKDGSVDDLLDDLVDEVHAALKWRAGEGQMAAYTTLGGLCQRARISDEIVYEPGESSDQAAAVIPIEVLTAD